MPTLKKTVPTDTFTALKADLHDDRGSCAVLALAVLTGRPAAEVQAALAAEGRKRNHGTHYHQTEAAAAKLGIRLRRLTRKEVQAIIDRYPSPHNRLQSVTTHHPRRFPDVWRNQPPMLFGTNSHVAAFKDGVVHDWSINRSLRLTRLYVAEPIELARPICGAYNAHIADYNRHLERLAYYEEGGAL